MRIANVARPPTELFVALVSAAVVSFSITPDAASALQADKIDRVVDGDTIVLSNLGRARLIGVNTPETVAPAQRQGAPPQCYGPEASAFVKKYLPAGTAIEYETDLEPLDRFGRNLVYLYKDGASVNERLVRDGAPGNPEGL